MENSVPDHIEGKNGGRLLTGGVPGNRGGGRPKDELRGLCAEGFEKAVLRANKRLETDDLTPEQEVNLLDKLGKYSIGTKTEVETRFVDGREMVDALLDYCDGVLRTRAEMLAMLKETFPPE